MFKKVYVEITNNCNLNCTFCAKNNRIKKFMKKSEFEEVLDKLTGYTEYIYFHLMGEPLLHPDINEFIDIASRKFLVNITTNGYLIKRIINNHSIRQLNISLHSFNIRNGKSLDEYLNDIFEVTDALSNLTYIQYRIWTTNEKKHEIITKLEQKYKVNIAIGKNIKLDNNVFLCFENEFIWPSMNNSYYSKFGTCLGTRTHVGILSDGTVVPCCLDSDGIIKLGNIFVNSLEEIIDSSEFNEIKKGFLNNEKVHELCKRCNFYINKFENK